MILEKCTLCPHECKVNRESGKIGRCKAGKNVKIALASVHEFEEPCISGSQGSGTVFFSNCNLSCVFCQNHKISAEGFGKEITIEHLAEIFLHQQEKQVHNINLVSPTIYAAQIIEAIKIAKTKGLKIPIVYNSSGYESIETIKMLEGYIDIYMPDFKYADDGLAEKYSGIKQYSKYAKTAICQMYAQVGDVQFSEEGILQKGVIVRHLVLPNHIKNTKAVLDWLSENMKNKVVVSLMAQYFPTHKAKQIPELNRKLTKREYEKVAEYLYEKDFKYGYIQELRKSRRRICTGV